jgi:hypothetical protein
VELALLSQMGYKPLGTAGVFGLWRFRFSPGLSGGGR